MIEAAPKSAPCRRSAEDNPDTVYQYINPYAFIAVQGGDQVLGKKQDGSRNVPRNVPVSESIFKLKPEVKECFGLTKSQAAFLCVLITVFSTAGIQLSTGTLRPS